MWVYTYDEKYRVNKRTGKNFDLIIEKVTPLVKKLANQYFEYLNRSFEDMVQDIYVLTLEAVYSFNSKHDVKFSTFLHMYLENKLITLLRRENTQKFNASYLYHAEEVREGGTIYGRRPTTLNFKMPNKSRSPSDNRTGDDLAPSSSSLYYSENPFNVIDFRLSLDSLIKKYNIDKDTVASIEGIYFHGETIEESIPKLKDGKPKISPWAMSSRFKSLGKRKSGFKELGSSNKQADLPAGSLLNKIFYIQ